MLKWKNLDGQQKYKVVELARKQETSVTELCRTFGVCRQTLYRAMDMADAAATQALSPKKRGRPRTSPTQKEIQELHNRNKELEQRLKRQEMKNQVAMALLDLHRKADRGEKLPGEKKTSR
jgi:transposase-like protein